MATLQERINMLAGELSPEEMTPQQTAFKTDTNEVVARLREAMQLETDPIKKQALQDALNMYVTEQKGAMSDKDMQIAASVTPNTIEENIAAIQKQMDDATTMSPEATQFMNARQELIDDVLMPLSNEGYSDLVNVILTKPRDSVEHNQAKTMLRNVMAQDEDFDMNDFEVMINMVSKEPRPADLINREGLPDAPPRSMGIGSLN
jgi:folate-binding Fe-S cluster repair protein YgfZ